MKQMKLTAVSLQRLFFAGIFILVVVSVFGFTALGKVLQNRALEVNHSQTDADIGSSNVKQLEQLNQDLESHKDVVQRAKQIVAESRSYQYQDQIVQDINSFASRAGITVLGYNFSGGSDTTNSNQGSSTPPPNTDTLGSASAVPQESKANIPAGVKTVTANITLKNPVPYSNFLQFLKLIEQNVTKMQITGISLSPDSGNPSQISNPTIGLIVYTR